MKSDINELAINFIIKLGIKKLKDNRYKPKAVWLDFNGDNIYIVTDDIDRNAKLLKKYK
jgi:hypothetical protein